MNDSKRQETVVDELNREAREYKAHEFFHYEDAHGAEEAEEQGAAAKDDEGYHQADGDGREDGQHGEEPVFSPACEHDYYREETRPGDERDCKGEESD